MRRRAANVNCRIEGVGLGLAAVPRHIRGKSWLRLVAREAFAAPERGRPAALLETAAMANRAPEVSTFLRDLQHPLKDGVIAVRDAILASDDAITERIKWKAPSFCYRGDDRVTFRLRPGDRLQLVFHRGVKVRTDADDFVFDDPQRLLEWAAPDRATLTLRTVDDVQARLPAVVELVGRWMRATP